jgi:hypothetical protein
VQAQPTLPSHGRELPLEVDEDLVQCKIDGIRAHRATFQASDVEHVVEHLLGSAHRTFDVCGDFAHGGILRTVLQRGGKETRGVQRLQQVMTRRGHETGLGGIRPLRRLLGGSFG